MDDCIFCKIVKGEIPSAKIYEDKEFLVILDAFPYVEGQTLVIPKKHIAPYLFNTDDEFYSKIMLFSKKVARAIDKSLKPLKTGLIVEGLELDHVHIKLYPLTKPFKMSTLEPRPSEEKMIDIAIATKMIELAYQTEPDLLAGGPGTGGSRSRTAPST